MKGAPKERCHEETLELLGDCLLAAAKQYVQTGTPEDLETLRINVKAVLSHVEKMRRSRSHAQ